MGLLEIQKENLRVTRSNLELARIRQRIGAAGVSEVYRWQTEIAGAEQGVVTAREARNVAKVALNRVLNRSQESRFTAEDVDLESPYFITSDPRFFTYIYSPRSYEIFIEFNVQEGLRRSPELEAFDASVAAARRALTAARRQLYIPDLVLSAQVTERVSESGAGSGRVELPIPIDLPQADDTDWSVGLFGALPLYTGGINRAAKRQAQEELYQLENERRSAAIRIEQRIRSAMHVANASYYSILLSRSAAETSLKSLELVTESYATGRVSIPELLDAQRTALEANEAASNAVYDFLIDLMELQRATNSFDFFQTKEDRDAYFDRLHLFMTERGVRPRPGFVPSYTTGSGDITTLETP
jgi:outer membrane protein TolC